MRHEQGVTGGDVWRLGVGVRQLLLQGDVLQRELESTGGAGLGGGGAALGGLQGGGEVGGQGGGARGAAGSCWAVGAVGAASEQVGHLLYDDLRLLACATASISGAVLFRFPTCTFGMGHCIPPYFECEGALAPHLLALWHETSKY